MLLLPAQGGWLAVVLFGGGVWWVVWGGVLGFLLANVVLVIVKEHRRLPGAQPAPVSPLLLAAASANVGWIFVAVAR